MTDRLNKLIAFFRTERKKIFWTIGIGVSAFLAVRFIRKHLAPQIVFPSFRPYYDQDYLRNHLRFFPKQGPKRLLEGPGHDAVTCRIFQGPADAGKMLIYFHGNGEDLGVVEGFVEEMCQAWKAHAVAVEYPGYGISPYPVGGYRRELFKVDALAVYDYLKEKLNLSDEQIVLVGRSIGTGPATLLAAERPNVGSLVLITPFTSLIAIANSKLPGLGIFVPNYFDNQTEFRKVTAPTLILHGLKDEVIPYAHSQMLYKAKIGMMAKLISPPDMSHNRGLDMQRDLLEPGEEILNKRFEGLPVAQKQANDKLNIEALRDFIQRL